MEPEPNNKVTRGAPKPSRGSGLDDPREDPNDDLLNMGEHAAALANYICARETQLPFTVGIFGQWGEGKTTMVNFLKRHLEILKKEQSKKLYYVEFSAWPFTTSEKLWQSLILQITKTLFGLDEDSKDRDKAQHSHGVGPAATPAEPRKSMNRFSKFLTNDFFPSPPTDYEQFVEQLEETDYGKVSKRTPSNQVNQEALASALVTGALSVAGTLSPIFYTLTELLPFRSTAERRAQHQAEESGEETFDALPKFRQYFGEMLKQKAGEEAVYVFIDDLDRAQPDVALDIMESIKIALSNVACVFILAVDDTLISEGLRLRYKELFADSNKDLTHESLAHKGEEYLEKIIQFRTRVPPRTREQTQRLIAAEFADWTPAGDIIQTITGNNPRRIKQYCQRLNFQKRLRPGFTVESPEDNDDIARGARTPNTAG